MTKEFVQLVELLLKPGIPVLLFLIYREIELFKFKSKFKSSP
jgi:hypothetical protein